MSYRFTDTMMSEPPLHGNSSVGEGNRRRHGRVFCQDISCSLGQVIDLSASGMQVCTRKRLPEIGQKVGITIESLDGPITLACVVRWIRKSGFFKHEAGVEFVDITAEARRALTALARASAMNETIRPDIEAARKAF